MKVFISLFAFLISVLLDQALSGTSIYGDVRLQTLNNGSLYCDSMMCPQGTASCTVTKRNDPNNFAVILRHRSCFDKKGALLAEQTAYQENTSNSHVNTQVKLGAGGQSSINGGTSRQMTPQEQRELNEYLRKQRQQMEDEISKDMGELNDKMRQFSDGSFAANLNNQIRSSMSKMRKMSN